MSGAKKTFLGVIIALAASIVISSPFLWRAGALYWAKSSARRAFNNLTPAERKSMNATPAPIILPANATAELATVEYKSFTLHVPPPQTRDASDKMLNLTYPHFQVSSFGPLSANAANFKTLTDANFARLDDIDVQPDLASLRKHILQLSGKPAGFSLSTCFEAFERPDIKGFIMAHDEGRREIFVELFFPRSQTGCGLFFRNPDGVDLIAVHEFLSVLQIESKPTATMPIVGAIIP